MKCLRCGHCCKNYLVIIVDDPSLGIVDGNLIHLMGNGEPCKHLRGNKIGEYECSIHSYPWFEETPCFAHTQVESSIECECRVGRYYLDQEILKNKVSDEDMISGDS